MNAQLTELFDHLKANAMRAQSLVWKTDPAKLTARPQPNAWSAAECLAHLTLSTKAFLPSWQSALASARLSGLSGDGPFTMDLLGRTLAWSLEPPPKFRAKAPANLKPVEIGDPLADFLASQDTLLRLVTDADGLALDRIKVPSPVDSRLRYNVWSSFQVTAAHQRRHLLQAEHAISPKD